MPHTIDAPINDHLSPWDRLLHSESHNGHVLYYFSSTECTFCQKAYPWIEAIERKYAESNLKVIAVDTIKNADIATSASVTGVPVLVMTAGGNSINRVVGWGDGSERDIEARLGLTDIFQTKPGLDASESDPTCEGCGKKDNSAIAELAENLAVELQSIRREIVDLRRIMLNERENNGG